LLLGVFPQEFFVGESKVIQLKLLPLQGDRLASGITQGDALG
jgi:hypothetical protein